MLTIKDLEVSYGLVSVLKKVSLEVKQGELVTIIGANGAGKTTLLRSLMALHPSKGGEVFFEGSPVTHLPSHKLAALGVASVPQGRRIFATMTVKDNLLVGGYRFRSKHGAARFRAKQDEMFALFPRLAERENQLAGTMSGGEQQMLAIARALISEPKLLLLDEPTMGLSPLLVEDVMGTIRSLKTKVGMTILMVEQMAFQALEISDRGYVLERGMIKMSGKGSDLLVNPEVKKAYLG